MAIIFPLAFPTTRGLTGIEFIPFAMVGQAESPFTGHVQTQPHQGQMWSFSLNLPPMKRPEAEEFIAFLLSLNGTEGTFLVGDPLGATPRGVATGTPLVKGASQTGRVLETDGWTPSTSGILLKGDYYNIGSGSTTRWHKLTKDAASDGGGNASLDIFPGLRESPADNAPLTLTNTKGLFQLASNEMPWSIGQAQYYGLSFGGIEKL